MPSPWGAEIFLDVQHRGTLHNTSHRESCILPFKSLSEGNKKAHAHSMQLTSHSANSTEDWLLWGS